MDKMKSPFIIGVGGGTASGKSTVCEEIMARLGAEYQGMVTMVTQDSFYRPLTDAEKALANRGMFNFDHPNAFDLDLMLEMLKAMSLHQPFDVAAYDYRANSRSVDTVRHYPPADVVLVEGILVLYYAEVRQYFDLKIFVETDPDTRLARRVTRDMMERGRELQQILNQYLNLVKPAFEEFCLPTKKFADVIIPRGGDNLVAIDLIVQHILEILRCPRSGSTVSGRAPYGGDNSAPVHQVVRNRPH